MNSIETESVNPETGIWRYEFPKVPNSSVPFLTKLVREKAKKECASSLLRGLSQQWGLFSSGVHLSLRSTLTEGSTEAEMT